MRNRKSAIISGLGIIAVLLALAPDPVAARGGRGGGGFGGGGFRGGGLSGRGAMGTGSAMGFRGGGVPWVQSAFVALPGVVEYVRVGDAPVGAAAGVEAGAAVGDGPLRLALRPAWRSVPLRLVPGAGVEAGATTVCNGMALRG
jgi:hypothetical protein